MAETRPSIGGEVQPLGCPQESCLQKPAAGLVFLLALGACLLVAAAIAIFLLRS